MLPLVVTTTKLDDNHNGKDKDDNGDGRDDGDNSHAVWGSERRGLGDKGRETRAGRWGQGLTMQTRCEPQVHFYFIYSYYRSTNDSLLGDVHNIIATEGDGTHMRVTLGTRNAEALWVPGMFFFLSYLLYMY